MTNIRDMKLFSYNDMREILEYGQQTLPITIMAQGPQIVDYLLYWMDCKLAGKPFGNIPQYENIIQKPLDKEEEEEKNDNSIEIKEEKCQ